MVILLSIGLLILLVRMSFNSTPGILRTMREKQVELVLINRTVIHVYYPSLDRYSPNGASQILFDIRAQINMGIIPIN